MSTQLRHIAQAPAHTPVRTKFFLTVASSTGNQGNAGDAVVNMAAGDNMSIMNSIDFSNAAGDAELDTPGTPLRDLGRQITVIAADGTHLYKYRNVQIVNGVGQEGVPSNYNTTASNLYVLVWSADSASVPVVVRTG